MAASWKQVRTNRIRQGAAAAMLLFCFALLIDAPTSYAQPPAVDVQQADGEGESPIDTSAAFALTRPVIDSMWEPIAWPMRHIELEGLAKRLGLTHEQMIAVERSHEAYFREAAAKRLLAIDALLKFDSAVLGVPHVVAPVNDVKGAVQARRAWHANLATLEAALFAQIGEVLGEEQVSRLPREAARRERARLATDAWVAQWWGNGGSPRGGSAPPEIISLELDEVLATMPLDEALRAAADQALAQGETAHLRQLRSMFDQACESRIRWCEAPSLEQPNQRYAAIAKIAGDLALQAGRCVAIERETADRIAALLPAELASEFRDRVARVVGGDLYEVWSGFSSEARAVLAQEALSADQRKKVEAMLVEFERTAKPLRYEWLLSRREAGKSMFLRIGGRSVSTHVDNSYDAANAASHSLLVSSNESLSKMREIVSDEIANAANHAVNSVDFRRRESESDASFAPTTNLIEPSANAHPRWVLPRLPGAADIDSAIRHSSVTDDAAAVIRALNEERAAAWSATAKAAESAYHKEFSYSRNDEVRVPDVGKVFEAYREAAAQLAASEAAFIDSLRVALDDLSPQAIELIALGRVWASMTLTPSSLPTPNERGRNWPRSMIRSHLDRVNLLRALLEIDASAGAIAPGIAVLREHAGTAAANMAVFRGAVLDALEADSAMMYAMNPQYGGDWAKAKDARLKQDETAMVAFERRKTWHAELRRVHEAVAAALDEPAAIQYRAAIQRIAYPSAVSGSQAALARFDRAAAIADVKEEQRGRLAVARSEAESQLQTIADEIQSLIDAHVEAEAYTPEAEAKCAAIYARLEHAMFLKDERCAAAIARIRPVLSAAQCDALLNPRSAQP